MLVVAAWEEASAELEAGVRARLARNTYINYADLYRYIYILCLQIYVYMHVCTFKSIPATRRGCLVMV